MTQVRLSTEAGCGLAIGRYPRFRYDGRGGGGSGLAGEVDGEGRQSLAFEAAGLVIPALSWRTTRLLGVPLPPGLAIAIAPQRLAGHWQPADGEVELAFEARFRFAVAGLYRAPDLLVTTRLSTGLAEGRRHRAEGRRLDAEGHGVLVGIARVEPCGDPLLDRFLGLPDEALAVLRCRLSAG